MLPESRSLNSPQSVTRVIHILEVLCASSGPVSLADLSRALDTPKSSMAALLRGLVAAEFVTFGDNVYSLGPGAFGLGSALLEARRRLCSSDLVREGMRKLAERSGETVLFAVRDADAQTLTYVEIIESRNAIRFSVSVGDRRPLYCTAGGRALLAADTQAQLRNYLRQLKPQHLTASTEVNKGRLATVITEVRERGVAQTVDQASEGVTGTAAAIRDATGQPVGALIVAAPSSRLQRRLAELAVMVRDQANAVSRSLGYRERAAG